jgi:spermidine synthase
MHGVQFPQSAQRPTSYYGVMTGIGLALSLRDPDAPSSIGVVGLGIGTLAAYGRPGDRFRFYEVDPAVIRIARDPRYFTYLADSAAEIELVEGDARVSLTSELEQGRSGDFDLLVIDAFSSDAIPMHLLTREAFELYGKLIQPAGLLAVHVSNRRLNLTPLVARLGENAGFAVVAVATTQLGPYLSAQSLWVFLCRDRNRIGSLAQAMNARRAELGLPEGAIRFGAVPADELAHTPLWTDDYSDLFGAMEPIEALFSAAPKR